MNGALLHEQAVLERMLPQRTSPFGERVAAPDIIDQDVEMAVVRPNSFSERADLVGHRVIRLDGDSDSAARRHKLGGFVDGLGPGSGRRPTTDTSSRAVHGRA